MARVRSMQGADLEAACRVLRHCYRWLGERGEYSPGQVEALIRERASAQLLEGPTDGGLGLVALVEGALAGLATATGTELTRLYVDPKHHRSGIGSELFRSVERRMRKDGRAELVLGTTRTALPFYLAHGLELRGEKVHGLPGFEGRVVLLMHKQLSG